MQERDIIAFWHLRKHIWSGSTTKSVGIEDPSKPDQISDCDKKGIDHLGPPPSFTDSGTIAFPAFPADWRVTNAKSRRADSGTEQCIGILSFWKFRETKAHVNDADNSYWKENLG